MTGGLAYPALSRTVGRGRRFDQERHDEAFEQVMPTATKLGLESTLRPRASPSIEA
jgi:hypothetical protein